MLLKTLAIADNYEKALRKYMRRETLSEEEMRNVVEGYGEIWGEISNHDVVKDIALLLLNWYPMTSNAKLVHNCKKLSETPAWKKAGKILSPKTR